MQHIREKLIYAGKTLEPVFYATTKNGRVYTRGKKKKISRAVQKKLNDENARKKLRRLLDENFEDEKDYYCTFTYRDDEMPSSYKEFKNDINNFLKRIRRLRNKNNLPELKYIYVIECTVSKRTGVARWHFHIVMSGGIDRKTIKKMWGHGDIKRVEELQSNEHGYEPLAIYFCKEWTNELLPENRKRYTPSRNLKLREPKIKDDVFSARYLEKLCKERIDDKEYWKKRYKGYRFVDATADYNEDYDTWHLSVFMRKKE
jgi:hypothetical protein